MLTFSKAVASKDSEAIKAATETLFENIPTNPVRASALYKQLNAKDPQIAGEVLNCYQSGRYIRQLDKGLEDRAAFIQAQIDLDEAEILAIREKIAKNLEPDLHASEERIRKLEEQIEQQKQVVDGIQEKVDSVAERLAVTQKNLQDAIMEQTRLDKEIALRLEDEDEDEEEDEESQSSGSSDTGRLKKQRSGQERIAELIQEEINHLKLNQKAASRELETAKNQLATLEDMLNTEQANHDRIEAEIEEQKNRIAELESQNASNAEEIAKLEIDREFIQSAQFTETFNALSGDIPLQQDQEEKFTRFIEEHAKSDTLQSAADSAHCEFLSEQEKLQFQQMQENPQHQPFNMLDVNEVAEESTLERTSEAEQDVEAEAEAEIEAEAEAESDIESEIESEQEQTQESVQEQEQEQEQGQEQDSSEIEEPAYERDLAMESATDHAVRMALTMEAEGLVPADEFEALMESLPDDMRNKVEPAVEERLIQKGIKIEQNHGAHMLSDATPTVFDPKSPGPRNEIDPARPDLKRAADLRLAFADSNDFRKFNADGVEASYDTKPITGIDPTIFQDGLNYTNFEPALDNTGPSLDHQEPERKPRQRPQPTAQNQMQPNRPM